MRSMLATAAVMFSFAAIAAEGSVSFNVDNFATDGNRSVLTIAVTNSTEETRRFVALSCAFMTSEGRALDVGYANVANIQPGETAWTQASISGYAGVEKAQCRIDNIR